MGHVLWILFGPAGWGTGGNLVAWVLCGVLAGLWLRAKMNAHHVAQLAQAALHHKQAMAQAQAHHDEKMAQAERHHKELKAHVTATVATPPEMTPAQFDKAVRDSAMRTARAQGRRF